MNIKFVEEMNVEDIFRYNNPIIITLSGLPGSGKTTVARELSKSLLIYLLSNDYIRNYYYQFTTDYSEEKRKEIEKYVSKVNNDRIKKLIESGTSFVYDRDFNSEEDFEKFKEDFDLSKFKLIKIKINSTDEHNIETIKNINMDYTKTFEGVLGDNIEYLSSFPENVYYEIKERKAQSLSNKYFDYVLDNIDQEKFNADLEIVIKDIKSKIS